MRRTLVAFDSDERLNWHFIPRVRQGLALDYAADPEHAGQYPPGGGR